MPSRPSEKSSWLLVSPPLPSVEACARSKASSRLKSDACGDPDSRLKSDACGDPDALLSSSHSSPPGLSANGESLHSSVKSRTEREREEGREEGREGGRKRKRGKEEERERWGGENGDVITVQTDLRIKVGKERTKKGLVLKFEQASKRYALACQRDLRKKNKINVFLAT